jgi:hypothetical protein
MDGVVIEAASSGLTCESRVQTVEAVADATSFPLADGPPVISKPPPTETLTTTHQPCLCITCSSVKPPEQSGLKSPGHTSLSASSSWS